MKKKGKYIYYIGGTEGMYWNLCRVKTTGGKVKYLIGGWLDSYAISGNKIYCHFEDDMGHSKGNKVMS